MNKLQLSSAHAAHAAHAAQVVSAGARLAPSRRQPRRRLCLMKCGVLLFCVGFWVGVGFGLVRLVA